MFAAFSPEDSHTAIERERLEAPQLARKLRTLSHKDAKSLAHSSADFHTWGLCEHLLASSWAARFDSAQDTLEYAELALCVADRLHEDIYGAQPLADLFGRTWTILGNAHRITSNYARAQECFEAAAAELAEGTDTPVFSAEFAHAHAQLLICQGRYTDAHALLEKARALYADMGDEHAVASVNVRIANTYGFSGDVHRAIMILNEIIPGINPATSATTFYAATQALGFFYEEAGDVDNSIDALRIAMSYYREHGDTLNIARIKWVQGKIARRTGNGSFAEGLFLAARQTFIDQEIGFDAAEVSLHLAELYLSTGRMEALFQLSAAIVPIFECRDMRERAAQALVYLQTAIETLTLDHMLIDRIFRYLKRARFDPELAFLPESSGK